MKTVVYNSIATLQQHCNIVACIVSFCFLVALREESETWKKLRHPCKTLQYQGVYDHTIFFFMFYFSQTDT